jgi:hypothetical protein
VRRALDVGEELERRGKGGKDGYGVRVFGKEGKGSAKGGRRAAVRCWRGRGQSGRGRKGRVAEGHEACASRDREAACRDGLPGLQGVRTRWRLFVVLPRFARAQDVWQSITAGDSTSGNVGRGGCPGRCSASSASGSGRGWTHTTRRWDVAGMVRENERCCLWAGVPRGERPTHCECLVQTM